MTDFLLSFPVDALLLAFLLAFGAVAYGVVAQRMVGARQAGRALHSLPGFSGWWAAILTAGPALALLAAAGVVKDAIVTADVAGSLPSDVLALAPERVQAFLNAARDVAFNNARAATDAVAAVGAQFRQSEGMARLAIVAVVVLAALGGFFYALAAIRPASRTRNRVEQTVQSTLLAASGIAILTTIGIVLSVVFETLQFFAVYSPLDFLFGLQWSPQTAIRADQVGQSGAFGSVPLFFGTLMISVIAMAVAVPIGLYAAIYLSEYASPLTRRLAKPALEILAGIPTVVYGFFALLTVAPAVKALGDALGVPAQPTSALAAGIVMGLMIIPFVSSLSDDVINATPQALRDGSFAMGATKSETVQRVLLPAALPGIVGAILLAASRAIGETMIVVMAASQRANITWNPFEDVTTITVQIVSLLTGDLDFNSPKTRSAFALGFVLFVVTLLLNIVALRIVQKYRERYE